MSDIARNCDICRQVTDANTLHCDSCAHHILLFMKKYHEELLLKLEQAVKKHFYSKD